VHIALPGATQNEVSLEEAKALVKAGARIVAEGSNMVRNRLCCLGVSIHSPRLQGCTEEAIEVFEASRKSGHGGVWYAPGSTSLSPSLECQAIKDD
jgi:glutamate dehydrogenase (NADP+)